MIRSTSTWGTAPVCADDGNTTWSFYAKSLDPSASGMDALHWDLRDEMTAYCRPTGPSICYTPSNDRKITITAPGQEGVQFTGSRYDAEWGLVYSINNRSIWISNHTEHRYLYMAQNSFWALSSTLPNSSNGHIDVPSMITTPGADCRCPADVEPTEWFAVQPCCDIVRLIHAANESVRPHISSTRRIADAPFDDTPGVTWVSYYKRTGNISEERPTYRWMTNTSLVREVSPDTEISGIADFLYFELGRWFAGDKADGPMNPYIAHLRESSRSGARCPADTEVWERRGSVTSGSDPIQAPFTRHRLGPAKVECMPAADLPIWLQPRDSSPTTPTSPPSNANFEGGEGSDGGASDADTELAVVGAVSVGLVAAAVMILGYSHRQTSSRTRMLRAKLKHAECALLAQAKETFYRCYGGLLTTADEVDDFEAQFVQMQLPGTALSRAREISRGPFGTVCKALLTHHGCQERCVAAKFGHLGNAVSSHKLIVEARLLLLLQHDRIIPLAAVCPSSVRPWLATVYRQNGDLKTHLRAIRQQFQNCGVDQGGQLLSDADALATLCGLAEGMIFLTGRGVIHGDIAARNVLVGDNPPAEVFLSDFGAAVPANIGTLPDRYSADETVPFRWMAPEALLESVQSHSTDVWAFGVLMWEVLTLGKTPYGALRFREVQSLLLSSQRLHQPDSGSPEIFRIASACWATDPKSRPTFLELRRGLGAIVPRPSSYDRAHIMPTDRGVHQLPASTLHVNDGLSQMPAVDGVHGEVNNVHHDGNTDAGAADPPASTVANPTFVGLQSAPEEMEA